MSRVKTSELCMPLTCQRDITYHAKSFAQFARLFKDLDCAFSACTDEVVCANTGCEWKNDIYSNSLIWHSYNQRETLMLALETCELQNPCRQLESATPDASKLAALQRIESWSIFLIYAVKPAARMLSHVRLHFSLSNSYKTGFFQWWHEGVWNTHLDTTEYLKSYTQGGYKTS